MNNNASDLSAMKVLLVDDTPANISNFRLGNCKE